MPDNLKRGDVRRTNEVGLTRTAVWGCLQIILYQESIRVQVLSRFSVFWSAEIAPLIVATRYRHPHEKTCRGNFYWI